MKIMNWKILLIGAFLFIAFWTIAFLTEHALVVLALAVLFSIFGMKPIKVKAYTDSNFTESELVDQKVKDLLGL